MLCWSAGIGGRWYRRYMKRKRSTSYSLRMSCLCRYVSLNTPIWSNWTLFIGEPELVVAGTGGTWGGEDQPVTHWGCHAYAGMSYWTLPSGQIEHSLFGEPELAVAGTGGTWGGEDQPVTHWGCHAYTGMSPWTLLFCLLYPVSYWCPAQEWSVRTGYLLVKVQKNNNLANCGSHAYVPLNTPIFVSPAKHSGT